jgi:hypothetical protein
VAAGHFGQPLRGVAVVGHGAEDPANRVQARIAAKLPGRSLTSSPLGHVNRCLSLSGPADSTYRLEPGASEVEMFQCVLFTKALRW